MKKCSLIFIFTLLTLLSYANLVKDKPFEHIQPDGTKLTLYVSGDEFYRQVFDEKGYAVLLDRESGYAVYAVPDGRSIKPSQYRVGSTDPAALGIPLRLEEEPEIVKTRVSQLRSSNDPTQSRNVTTGQFNNLVVFIRFADQTEFPAEHNRSYFNTFYNGTGDMDVSLKKFFLEDSNNQLTVDTYMYPNSPNNSVVSYLDSHERSYYVNGDFDRLAVLLRNAIVYLAQNNQVPTNIDFDADNNGWLDNVNFVIRGNSSSWGNPLWPHSWTFDELGALFTVLNGLQVQNYTLTFEGDGTLATNCHEFSHTIGFPDLYHYYSYQSVYPTAGWDLMGDHPDIPIHHLVWMKYKYGHWCSAPLTNISYGYFNLNPVVTNTFGNYKFATSDPDEFLMVEYRLQDGLFESNIRGSGLVVYRINTSVGDGNADGPPDEVYVYREWGDNHSNGDTSDSYYSAQKGRTAIHQYTNPKPQLTNWDIDSGLILTEIGTASSSISFRRRNSYPKIWTGDNGSDWFDEENWINGVPDLNYDVEITSGNYYYPVVPSTAHCKSLHIDPLAQLTILGIDLIIHENFINNGELILSGVAGLNVYGDTAWNHGATITIDNPNAYIDARGDMDFNIGSDINMTAGRIEFGDPDTAWIRVFASTVVSNIISYKTAPNYLGISAASTSVMIVNGGIYVNSGKSLKNYHPGMITIKGNLVANGNFNCYDGTIIFDGDVDRSITCSSAPGNDFYNLKCSTNGTANVNLLTPIKVKGYLSIMSGILNTNNNNIEVQGNWNNMCSPQNFIEGTSTVTFSGTLNQVIRTEEFYNLVLNKSAGEMQIPSASNVYCINYDWVAGTYVVDGGSFMVRELADPGIFGNIILNSGSIGYFVSPEVRVDLRGNLTIHGGSFTVDNGISPCNLSYGDTATLNMDGGLLEFLQVGILVPSTGTFNNNISGGTIKTPLGFEIARSGFNPTGGTILLSGSNDCNLTGYSGSNFFNVVIDKGSRTNTSKSLQSTATRQEDPIRSNTVTGSGTLDINGNFTITSGTFTAPPFMYVAGYWTRNGTFNHNSGDVIFDGNSTATGILTNANFYNLAINNASTDWNNFKIAAGDTVTVSYNLVVSDGTVVMQNNSVLTVNYNVNINAGAGINCTQGTGVIITVKRNWTDSNTAVTDAAGFKPGLSTLNFYGMTAQTINVSTPYFEVYHLALSKNVLLNTNFNKPVHVLGNCNLNSGTWTDTATGFVHEFNGNFSIGINGRWNSANRNTISFTGLADQTFTNGGTSYFYNLSVNKTLLTGIPVCYLGSNITLSNGGTTQINSGVLDLNHYNLATTGAVNINNSGIIRVDANADLRIAPAQNLNVNSGGRLEVIGADGQEAMVTATSGGYYALNVESGGTISAEYAFFQYTDLYGVNVKAGALVDQLHPFHNCMFLYGAGGAVMLTLNNNQDLTICNAYFPNNIEPVIYNVAKTVNQGSVTFVNAYGDFSGAAYENDAYNRITWSASALDLKITSFEATISEGYVCDPILFSVTVLNDSDADINEIVYVDLFYDLDAEPEPGVYGDDALFITSLAAHASHVFTFAAASSTEPGIWNSRCIIDTDNDVLESNESNNTAGPLTITWNALPAVENLSIAYDDVSQNVILNWTYPAALIVNRFNIYKSFSSDGPFSTLAGTSESNTYSESPADDKCFYQVRAEKTWP